MRKIVRATGLKTSLSISKRRRLRSSPSMARMAGLLATLGLADRIEAFAMNIIGSLNGWFTTMTRLAVDLQECKCWHPVR